MEFEEMNAILEDYIGTHKEKIRNISWETSGLTILKVRDVLIVKGKIFFEDLERQMYVACINGGLAHKNPATMVLHLDKERVRISIYARESFFDQHTCEGVLHELETEFKEYINEITHFCL